jgi:hypothetical protein
MSAGGSISSRDSFSDGLETEQRNFRQAGPTPHFCVSRGNKRVAGGASVSRGNKGVAGAVGGMEVTSALAPSPEVRVSTGMIGVREVREKAREGRYSVPLRTGGVAGKGCARGLFVSAQGNHGSLSRKLYRISIVLHSTGTIFRGKSNGRRVERQQSTVDSSNDKKVKPKLAS